MAHIGNIYDYRRKDAMFHFVAEYNGDSVENQFEKHVKEAKKFRIGRPKATRNCTTDYLESIGYIGLYDTEEPQENEHKYSGAIIVEYNINHPNYIE